MKNSEIIIDHKMTKEEILITKMYKKKIEILIKKINIVKSELREESISEIKKSELK